MTDSIDDLDCAMVRWFYKCLKCGKKKTCYEPGADPRCCNKYMKFIKAEDFKF